MTTDHMSNNASRQYLRLLKHFVWRERRDFSFQDLAVSAVICEAKKGCLLHFIYTKKTQNELFPSNKVIYE